jgi:hypothetical protein
MPVGKNKGTHTVVLFLNNRQKRREKHANIRNKTVEGDSLHERKATFAHFTKAKVALHTLLYRCYGTQRG